MFSNSMGLRAKRSILGEALRLARLAGRTSHNRRCVCRDCPARRIGFLLIAITGRPNHQRTRIIHPSLLNYMSKFVRQQLRIVRSSLGTEKDVAPHGKSLRSHAMIEYLRRRVSMQTYISKVSSERLLHLPVHRSIKRPTLTALCLNAGGLTGAKLITLRPHYFFRRGSVHRA